MVCAGSQARFELGAWGAGLADACSTYHPQAFSLTMHEKRQVESGQQSEERRGALSKRPSFVTAVRIVGRWTTQ